MRPIPDDMTAKVMAAAQLFAERGLDGATMSDIAEVTGIPRATLYYHFEGKEAVCYRAGTGPIMAGGTRVPGRVRLA
jgi:AcrR family transcriptional regulator